MINYYEILGVSSTSSRNEIKQSYHNLIREHHPDKNMDQCSRTFHLIDEAWKILSDDSLRRKYDAELTASKLHSVHPVQEEVSLSSASYNIELEQYERDCRCGGKYILSKTDICDELILVDCDNCSLSIIIDCTEREISKTANS